MSLSQQGSQTNNTRISSRSFVTSLNPNAAEFVPLALRSSSLRSASTVNATARLATAGTSGKSEVNRSESSVSNNSDEEVHQFWQCQLPDDITPDFKVMGEDESPGLRNLSLAGLSLHDDSEASRFHASKGSGYLLNQRHDFSQQHINGNSFANNLRFSGSMCTDDSSTTFMNVSENPWDRQIGNSDPLVNKGGEGLLYDGNSRHRFINDVLGEHAMVDTDINPLEFLASQFPGFAAQSLSEVYFASGCDLNLTAEMLTQMELQVDGSFNQNLNSKALSTPDLSAMDFPALKSPDGRDGSVKVSGNSIKKTTNPYWLSDKENMLFFNTSSSMASRGAVKKLASQDSGLWKYDKNGFSNANIGSSRSSLVLASSYGSVNGKGIYGDWLQNPGAPRTAPMWLETGDAVANMYSELREEARDHARLCNAYFEQAQQAYLIGNKSLAKELSVKGQLHNMHMKAANEKSQESIYHLRNPVAPDKRDSQRGQERMIELHGLHASEAIHVLKHELSVLRSTARAADQHLHVYISVGTGGSRTPSRLPIAVQRYLLEEEGLDYSEPQAGLLHVVIY